jgi:hypothetical protein
MLVSKNTYCTNLDSAPSSSFVPQIMRSCAKNVSFSLSNIFYSRRKSLRLVRQNHPHGIIATITRSLNNVLLFTFC